MIFSKLAVMAALSSLANAAIVYVDAPTSYAVVTAAPSQEYVTVTADSAAVVTKDSTIEETQTIYRATTKPVTLYTGTIVTILSTVEPNRVQPANVTSDAAVTQKLSPSSFTAARVIGNTASASASAAATASSPGASSLPSSTLQTVTSASGQNSAAAAGAASSSALSSQSPSSAPGSTSELISSASSASAAAAAAASSAGSSAPESSAAVSSPVAAAASSAAAPAAAAASSAGSASGAAIYSEGTDIFKAIGNDAPPSVFPSQTLDITLASSAPSDCPIHTNKFYANMLLQDGQHFPAYVQPYSVWWSNLTTFPGFAISSTNKTEYVYGPDANLNPVEYYINPVGLISLAFSADGFSSDSLSMKLTDLDTFSANVALSDSNGGTVEFPLVQGMGFVTAKYDGTLTPHILSQLGIDTFVQSPSVSSSVQKYVATLFNGVSWLVYVTVPDDATDFKLTVDKTSGAIVGSSKTAVVIQVAAAPSGSESSYDKAAGMYPVSAAVSGSVGGDATASFSIKYNTKGNSVGGTTLIMALPHHLENMSGDCANTKTPIVLDSTTKGVVTGFLTNSLTFSETLNQDIQFLPWSSASSFNSEISYSASALQKIAAAANSEITSDLNSATNLDSTYFSGKALDKYAYILLVLSEILDDSDVTKSTLDRLKTAFATFTENKQQVPLMYDTLIKGITSTGAQGGDPNGDFGSPFYNDHHFHYGYFLHAAAVVAMVDKKAGGTWGDDNKAWVNSLIRDVANPSSDDSYFPVFRSFDWYSGHSWAKGLFASSDGKDEESSSEDYNFAYGMKMWGNVIGDASMEARGDLMLSVMRRSLNSYFYMADDNEVQPSNFINNKVPGITFENKIDHTTYFGTNIEYIQGIHMIPVTPVSSYLRTPTFVQQEWEQVLDPVIDNVNSGWLGILRSNQALYDPKSAYEFFSQDNFDQTWLDGGASLTWYLAFSAGVGGASA